MDFLIIYLVYFFFLWWNIIIGVYIFLLYIYIGFVLRFDFLFRDYEILEII